MNKKQKELQNLLMDIPMNKLPKSLFNMITEIGKKSALAVVLLQILLNCGYLD